MALGLRMSSSGLVKAEFGELLALLRDVLRLAAEACPASSGRAEKEPGYMSWFLGHCVSRGHRDKNGTRRDSVVALKGLGEQAFRPSKLRQVCSKPPQIATHATVAPFQAANSRLHPDKWALTPRNGSSLFAMTPS